MKLMQRMMVRHIELFIICHNVNHLTSGIIIFLTGGPTRNFLMQLWNQISQVTLLLSDGSQIRIFDDCGEFILPSRDVKIQAKARPLYRGIGRIISYCILHKHMIANHVLVSVQLVLS